ncbi:MAG: zinc-dependent metalloprotease [Dysgonamonadaceae bacterium]|jgi:hypothetical protein|nr:zinc-dependent metalloprotease [Dysgonamonadaceae bacterium]
MNKLFVFLLIAAMSPAIAMPAEAGLFKKKKAKESVKVDPPKKPDTPWEKLFKNKKPQSAKSAFISLHKMDGKLYFEIPLKYLNREMLLASTLSEISTTGLGDIGYKSKTPLHVTFTQNDSTIHLRQIATEATTDSLQVALSRTFNNPILYSYPIKAYNPDSSAVVIDMTALFTGNEKIFEFLPESMGGGLAKLANLFKKESSSLEEIKAFDDNLSIQSVMSYSLSLSLLTAKLLDNYPVTAKVTRSLLLLPEEKMTPRISDSRVGIFNSTKQEFSIHKDKVDKYSIAHRWRLVPQDVEAYQRGELTEPVKPIVFYVDNAFPELWKAPIREAIEKWNLAFEKIGFKNAVQAKDFPTDDPEFDPDNLKYSCVRYVPSATANAMGPSWVDPTTGEIVNASVLVYGNIVELLNNWRFIQTAQIDPRVRSKKMPDDVIMESLIYVVSHEIGHCLGFMHNMASSAAFSVESLRSPEFTQANGTTPCIMDYARFNYIAQPEDAGVKLTPPELGTYDYFLIKWNYQYLGLPTEWDEKPVVEKWVDEKAGDPIYRYGRQQMQSRYDPSSIEEDLSNDPIQASNYGIKNLKYILSNLNTWIENDEDFTQRSTLYNSLLNQYYRYVRNVLYNIGGIYLTEVKEGTPGDPHQPVPAELQKTSLQWVLNEYKTLDWIDNAELKAKFPLQVDASYSIRDRILKDLKGQTSNVILSSHYAEKPYSLETFTNDLYAATWRSLLKGGKLTPGDKALQKAMVDMFCEALVDKQPASARTALGYSPSVDEIIAYHLDATGLVERFADIFRRYEAENGAGSVAAELNLDDSSFFCHSGCGHNDDSHFGKTGHGFQGRVTTTLIDDSKALLQDLAVKSRHLLKARLAGTSGSARTHYQSLLIKLNTALKDVL